MHARVGVDVVHGIARSAKRNGTTLVLLAQEPKQSVFRTTGREDRPGARQRRHAPTDSAGRVVLTPQNRVSSSAGTGGRAFVMLSPRATTCESWHSRRSESFLDPTAISTCRKERAFRRGSKSARTSARLAGRAGASEVDNGKVKDGMTRSVAVCNQDDTLNRAAQLMWEGDCGCIPVLDAGGDVRGIITDRDVCMAAYTQGLPLQQIPVVRAMLTVVHTCGPEDSIESALALMRRNKVRRVPVTDGVRPVGMLSISDVMRVLRSSQPARQPEGAHAAIIETLSSFSSRAPRGRRPRPSAVRETPLRTQRLEGTSEPWSAAWAFSDALHDRAFDAFGRASSSTFSVPSA